MYLWKNNSGKWTAGMSKLHVFTALKLSTHHQVILSIFKARYGTCDRISE